MDNIYNYELKHIDSYSMKCRLYPNKTQTEYMNRILHGIHVAYNNTLFALRENTESSLRRKGKNTDAEFPDFPKIAGSEWLKVLRDKHPDTAIVPAAALSSNIGGALGCDIKKAWEKQGKLPINIWFASTDQKGRKRVNFYSQKKPRTSFYIQMPVSHIEGIGTKSVYVTPSLKIGRIKVRGWNEKISFSADGMQIVPQQKTVGIRIEKDSCNDWYIIFTLKDAYRPVKKNMAPHPIGVDPGIRKLATTSDGKEYTNNEHKKQAREELNFRNKQLDSKYGPRNSRFREDRKESRRYNDIHREDIKAGILEKKTKGLSSSKRYEKAKIKKARLERKVARKREYDQNVATAEIVADSSFLGLEPTEAKNIQQDAQLSEKATDAAMGRFNDMLKYKAGFAGISYHVIDPARPSTNRCSSCGYVLKEDERLKLGQNTFVCPKCGHTEDRDSNAAKIMLQTAQWEEGHGIPSYVPPKEKKKKEYKDTPVSKKNDDFFVHFSRKMAEKKLNPFIIIDKEGNTVDDAQGYGYEKAVYARQAFNYKQKNKKST